MYMHKVMSLFVKFFQIHLEFRWYPFLS